MNILKILYSDYGFLNAQFNYEINEVRNNFILDFYIDEGNKFLINNVIYSIDESLNSILNKKEINNINKKLINSNYSSKNINDLIINLNDLLIDNNLSNYSLDFSYNIISDNTVNVDIYSTKVKPIIINKINFYGNAITKDKTLRRQIFIKPGDIYNIRKANKSKNNLQKNSYIDKVDISLTSKTDNSSDVDITLKEKIKTGNLFIGAGYDSDFGASTSVGLSDDNFYGTGNKNYHQTNLQK